MDGIFGLEMFKGSLNMIFRFNLLVTQKQNRLLGIRFIFLIIDCVRAVYWGHYSFGVFLLNKKLLGFLKFSENNCPPQT